MTKFLFSLFLFLSLNNLVYSQPAASLEEAQKLVEQKCLSGCLVLSPEDIAALQATLNAEIKKAYEAGLKGWSKVS